MHIILGATRYFCTCEQSVVESVRLYKYGTEELHVRECVWRYKEARQLSALKASNCKKLVTFY